MDFFGSSSKSHSMTLLSKFGSSPSRLLVMNTKIAQRASESSGLALSTSSGLLLAEMKRALTTRSRSGKEPYLAMNKFYPESKLRRTQRVNSEEYADISKIALKLLTSII